MAVGPEPHVAGSARQQHVHAVALMQFWRQRNRRVGPAFVGHKGEPVGTPGIAVADGLASTYEAMVGGFRTAA